MIRRALICLALLCGLTGPGTAQTRLDIPQARLAAAQLIDAGQPGAAHDITTVLLARDPSDIAALILHAHASRMLGRQSVAQGHARRAWRISDSPVDRYGAAIAMAQSLSTGGNKTMAQFWLRRAVQSAPTPQTRARAVQDYRFVRLANPWQFTFRTGISPTDNVNNAPRDNTMKFGGLVLVDPTAIPLSGARLLVGGTVRLNFNIAQTRRDYVAVFLDDSQAFLSESAKLAVPSAQSSDYDFLQYGFEIGRDFAPGPQRPRSTLSLRATLSDYGGEPFADELRLRFLRRYDLAADREFAWSAAIARNERQDNATRSSTIGRVTAHWTLPLAAASKLDWFAGVERQASESAAIANDAVTLALAWTRGRPVLGAELSLGVAGAYRNFDQPLYGPEPREDKSLLLSASLFFRTLDAYGFAPKLTIMADRTDSNITLFETEEIGLSLTLQSVF